jgi:hypothetical protein
VDILCGDSAMLIGGISAIYTDINNTYSTGNIITGYSSRIIGGLGGECIRGLVGENDGGTLKNCYSSCKISVDYNSQYIGSLIAGVNIYVADIISRNIPANTLIDDKDFSWWPENCFCLISKKSNNGFGKPLSDNQMKHQANFTNWDFNNIWKIDEGIGYPQLIWEPNRIYLKKCRVVANINGDSILVWGLMSATDDDFDNADEITVTFSAAPQSVLIPIHTQHFPINEDTYNDGSFSGLIMECVDWSFISTNITESVARTSSISSTDPKSHFDYSVKTHKFKVTVKKADLSGLCSPVSMAIQVGSYSAETEIDENIINGKKPIPINLLMGVKNSLRVDKTKFTRDRKTGYITRSAVRGGFSVEKINEANLVINPVDITVGSMTFTIPAHTFEYVKGKFACSKVPLPDGETASAAFDFNKCKFSLIIKGTKIPDAAGDADFKLEFDDFSEQATILLP